MLYGQVFGVTKNHPFFTMDVIMDMKEYDDLIEFLSNDSQVSWDVSAKDLSIVFRAIHKFYKSTQELKVSVSYNKRNTPGAPAQYHVVD